MAVDHSSAGLVEDIESTRVGAAVTGGSCAVPVAVRKTWALLLGVVKVRAQACVCAVALVRVPGPHWLELDEPWGIHRIVQDDAHLRVPVVGVHAVAVCAEDGGWVLKSEKSAP